MIISIQNRLTELQKTFNLLLASEVRPAQGEPPSNKFLFYLKLQFIAIYRAPTVLLTISPFFGAFRRVVRGNPSQRPQVRLIKLYLQLL